MEKTDEVQKGVDDNIRAATIPYLPVGEVKPKFADNPPIPELSSVTPKSNKRFWVFPLVVVLLLFAIGTFLFVGQKKPDNVVKESQKAVVTQVETETSSDNLFDEKNIPEDNPFDDIETDGSVYQNPFDVMDEQIVSSNPFEELR